MKLPLFSFILFLCCISNLSQAQSLSIIKDINSQNVPFFRHTFGFTKFNNLVYFQTIDSAHGQELWVTDGTTAGTNLVKDINPGGFNSDFVHVNTGCSFFKEGTAIINGELFFNGHDSTHGTALWKTDGTANGTVLVKDISPILYMQGSLSGGPFCWYFRELNGQFVFITNDLTHGQELWITDGTSVGTNLLKDINTDINYNLGASQIRELVKSNGKVFFTADNPTYGRELWVTDGTTSGTNVLDLQTIFGSPSSASNSSSPKGLYSFNNELYFIDQAGVLYKTDGTISGTVLLGNPSSANEPLVQPQMVLSNDFSIDKYFTEMGGKLYFKGEGVSPGVHLWMTDGTALGTQLVHPNASSNTSFQVYGDIAVFNNQLIFGGFDTNPPARDGLYMSDGTPNGLTTVMKSQKWFNVWANPKYFKNYNGRAYFSAGQKNGPLSTLWTTDGTPNGTYEVIDSTILVEAPPIVYNNRMYFRSQGGSTFWESAGDSTNTKALRPMGDTSTNTEISFCSRYPLDDDFVEYNGTLIFSNNWLNTGFEPWKLSTFPLKILTYERNDVDFTIYPNPAKSGLKIKTEEEIEKIILFDISGKRILSMQHKSLDVSQLSNGTYILKVHTSTGVGSSTFQINR